MSVKPRFIISDLHFGDGQQRGLEDFDEQAAENFIEFFEEISLLGGVKVIINGDFIDFPQIRIGTISTPPQKFLGVTESESTLRLQKALAGHPDEFRAIKKFLAGKGNELLLIPGNHDVDFAWNRVLRTFMKQIGARSQNFKFGMVYKEAGVYVTHGHQYSDDSQIDVPLNFTFNRLNSCWGTHFVEHFFNNIEERYPLLDNARPMWKAALSAILYEELLVTGEFAAEFLVFLKNFRMPLKDYIRSAILGWKPKTRSLRKRDIENLTTNIKVHALRMKLEELRGEPEFRRGFDAVFQELHETQWEQIFSNHASTEYELLEFLQNTDSRPQARGLISKRSDNYQQAAKFIARYHADTQAVIMGHTHNGHDAKELRVEDGKRTFRYYNTGTWTKSYDIPWWKLPGLEELNEPGRYTSNSGIIRCTGADDNLQVKYFEHWDEAI